MTKKINAKIGETFKIGNYEFVRFPNEQGGVAVVFKDILFNSDYRKNNNLSESKIMKKLKAEILPELEELIGAENILEFDTDLTSLDGSKKHGTMRSRISLPTFDFYRENREIFEKHNPRKWFWLATPWETSEYTDDYWVVCVAPRGLINGGSFNGDDFGVRPFLIFSSSIFESFAE
jgi:hypothetical protein